MSILVVGSVALDEVETPFGRREGALGGAATYFALAASYFTHVRLVGVVGTDFPAAHIELLERHGIDLAGLQIVEGETFRWGGRYGYDLNTRETLYTHLNVFADFDPVIPADFRESEHVFLANIAPNLQLGVLEQVPRPRTRALDTMNYWIQRTPAELARVIERVEILLINDSETRELAGEPNLRQAAASLLARGPRLLVVKKGEHGAVTFMKEGVFAVPGLPLEKIQDPTGAGDAFAGGFLGYLAATGELTVEGIRRATIYGSAMGSLCCEAFSVERLVDLDGDEIESRFHEFKRLTHFDAQPVLRGA
ncbi:MAG TPA: PfkB family carbohydrate kinase [Gemmatimonadota bacterium]|nr:PfkB family carbohydrate kinase [Gemmatimonadota bacterium]